MKAYFEALRIDIVKIRALLKTEVQFCKAKAKEAREEAQ